MKLLFCTLARAQYIVRPLLIGVPLKVADYGEPGT